MRMRYVWAGLFALAGCANETSKSAPDVGVAPDPARMTLTLGQALEGISGEGQLQAKLKTSQGTIVIALFEQQTPRTVANFVALARGRRPFIDPDTGEWVERPFYDGLLFHRVIPGFIIQGGCPRGDGRGGPGYVFDDEPVESLVHDRAGLVGMVSAGPNTNGSQFYITDSPAPHLDGQTTLFGRVVKGRQVVQKIARVARDADDRPKTPVTILTVTIERG